MNNRFVSDSKLFVTTLLIAALILFQTSCSAYNQHDDNAVISSTEIEVGDETLPNSDVPLNPSSDELLGDKTATVVHVISVDEALSVLIDDGDVEILIDGGNDRDGANVSSYIDDYVEDDKLEYVIATHSHADHIGGLDQIYKDYDVDYTIYGDKGTTLQFGEFWDNANSISTEVYNDISETITLSDGVTLTVLEVTDDNRNTNNNSVVSVLDCYGQKMLVTGDLEDEKSKQLRNTLIEELNTSNLYPIDVYIVGHHGSETSSSAELLSLIQPTYSIISSEGPYGQYENPNIDVLKRLEAINTAIFSTYKSENITVTFDGTDITLSSPESEQITSSNYTQ